MTWGGVQVGAAALAIGSAVGVFLGLRRRRRAWFGLAVVAALVLAATPSVLLAPKVLDDSGKYQLIPLLDR